MRVSKLQRMGVSECAVRTNSEKFLRAVRPRLHKLIFEAYIDSTEGGRVHEKLQYVTVT